MLLILIMLAAGTMSAFFLFDRSGFTLSSMISALQGRVEQDTLSASQTSSPSYTPTATSTLPAATQSPVPTRSAYYGNVIVADYVYGYSHLLAVSPGDSRPRQLTQGEWNSYDPAVSPDGRRIAFRSDRNGYQELYWMETASLEVHQITDTSYYEGNPTWSPDGRWLCFEVYNNGNFDLWIDELEGGQLYMLTDHAGLDVEPSWNPAGRQIAFVSDRDGSRDIFLADLENPDHRFINLTNSLTIEESSPVFSMDGKSLAFSGYQNGVSQVYVVSLDDPAALPASVGQGISPAWAPDNRALAAVLAMPGGAQLVSYAVDQVPIQPLGIPLLSSHGVSWLNGSLPEGLPYLERHPDLKGIEEYEAEGIDAYGRFQLVDLPEMGTPAIKLSAAVDDSFTALRQHVLEVAGWDVLGSIDHGFVGINDPLPPGFAYNDWLYTGRAFTLTDAMVPSGWAVVLREDYGIETFWRLYVRVLPQDGSAGVPLRDLTWDFEARYLPDPETYDLGGALSEAVPEGYYLDFSELALAYGYERLPALQNWRRFIPGSRYNEFAAVDGLTWDQAMAQVYPPGAVRTPTPYQTPTATPTRTPRPTSTPWWSY